MEIKVLIAEDQQDIREEIIDCLSNDGFECIEAVNGEEGLDLLRRDKGISIVLSDFLMPGKSGLEMIEAAQSEVGDDRDIEYIVLTGHGGTAEAIDAMKLGVIDFLSKPVDPPLLIQVVRRAEQLVLLKRSSRHYKAGLEAEVQSQTREIQKLLSSLRNAYVEAIECLALASGYKDEETGNHSRRIGEYAQLVAKELGWTKERQETMLLAAPLHDLGKVGTPDSILLKPGKLDAEELAIMKGHANNGYEILSHAKHPVMKAAANIARGHHERWDGSGYPQGLKGTAIPIEARIASLVDVYDALRSERPYKPAFDQEKTLSIILEGDGRTDPSHFDPEILEILRKNSDQFNEIYLKFAD